MIQIGILKSSNKTPLGVTPNILKKWPTDTISFLIEKQAGLLAHFSDDQYLTEGAKVVSRTEVLEQAQPFSDFRCFDGSRFRDVAC